MSKIETATSGANQGERLLDEGELEAVSGGIGDEENFMKPVVTMPFLARLLAEDH